MHFVRSYALVIWQKPWRKECYIIYAFWWCRKFWKTEKPRNFWVKPGYCTVMGTKKVVYFKRYYRVTTWDLKLLVLYKSHFHCVISVRIRSVSGPNAGKYGPEKLQTQTIFPQCLSFATLHVWNTTFQYFVLLGKFLFKTMQKSCSIESSKSDFM